MQSQGLLRPATACQLEIPCTLPANPTSNNLRMAPIPDIVSTKVGSHNYAEHLHAFRNVDGSLQIRHPVTNDTHTCGLPQCQNTIHMWIALGLQLARCGCGSNWAAEDIRPTCTTHCKNLSETLRILKQTRTGENNTEWEWPPTPCTKRHHDMLGGRVRGETFDKGYPTKGTNTEPKEVQHFRSQNRFVQNQNQWARATFIYLCTFLLHCPPVTHNIQNTTTNPTATGNSLHPIGNPNAQQCH